MKYVLLICDDETVSPSNEELAADPVHQAWLADLDRRGGALVGARLRQLAVLARDPDEPTSEEIPDERLRLIFTCCHPALPLPARVALTLRTLAGLSTAEIARALLTAEPAMAQRLVRAKRLLHESRRATRIDDGVLVTLENQDRSRWDRALIAEGVTTLDQALTMRRTGPYQVQAAIAACHATAPDAASTDWPQIATLYGELARLAPSPVVDLNRAVAVAMADGIPVGLALVDELAASGGLEGYHLLPATRADLLRRDGRTVEARAAYEEALKLAPTEAERRYLTGRLEEL